MKIPVFCAGALQVRVTLFCDCGHCGAPIRYFGLAYLGKHFGLQTFQYLKTHGWRVAGGALLLAALLTLACGCFKSTKCEIGKPE